MRLFPTLLFLALWAPIAALAGETRRTSTASRYRNLARSPALAKPPFCEYAAAAEQSSAE